MTTRAEDTGTHRGTTTWGLGEGTASTRPGGTGPVPRRIWDVQPPGRGQIGVCGLRPRHWSFVMSTPEMHTRSFYCKLKSPELQAPCPQQREQTPPPRPPQSDRCRAVCQPWARGSVCSRVTSGRPVRDTASDDASLDGHRVFPRAHCTRGILPFMMNDRFLLVCDPKRLILETLLVQGALISKASKKTL